MNTRVQAERDGRRGETFAAFYLQGLGWEIVARRAKTPRGEVDILARRENVLCAFEVKWRSRSEDLDTAIDMPRLRRVAAATEILASQYAKEGDDIRIDVLLLSPNALPRHIENAWQPYL